MKENEGKEREKMNHYSIGNAIWDWREEEERKNQVTP